MVFILINITNLILLYNIQDLLLWIIIYIKYLLMVFYDIVLLQMKLRSHLK